MAVLAVLQAAAAASATNTVNAPVTPIPAPASLIGSPTVVSWVSATDLPNAQMKYSYLIYQTYNAAGGAQGLAQASGTTNFISIPDVSKDFPNISVSTTATSALAGGTITFTINGTIDYTQTTPGLYTVTTE